MTNIVLRTISPYLAIVLAIYSIFLLLNGDNSIGGGFSGGLISAISFIVYNNSFNLLSKDSMKIANPINIIILGLILIVISSTMSLFYNLPFMTNTNFVLNFEIIKFNISTIFLFDLSVYLIVLGSILIVISVIKNNRF